MIIAWALSLLCFCLTVEGKVLAIQNIPALNSYNPGPCVAITHGKEVLVKNRADEEIILICVKSKHIYQWKPLDDVKNTIGEYFNPGLSCSDILDKFEDAIDGFYWITFNKIPIKVYCDMTTDGGGYMLIGRTNNSYILTIPSNNMTVEPYGEPHWSTSLGDAPVLDFRVQVATKEDFKTTKAHWSYRLQSKRLLKTLMMSSAGCDQTSAGIGNIAYVKDLLIDDIVTTKLRCSKFGFGHHPLAKVGWYKMNLCFQRPCPWGFAFLDVVRHQVDFHGSFSFSTTGGMSGMEYNATASVGCDNGKCCGCFGPIGGTKDYCAGNCLAINGGTVTKFVYTWFWVRSSLPKRLWKKCMDYQVKRNDGKLISYKLVGHSVVPIEGSCGKDSTIVHDGVVVVPDSPAAQKVPAIDGLLEYRKDKQELYIRSNKTWNVIASEKKIFQEMDKKDKINFEETQKIEQKINNIKQETDRKVNLILEKMKKNDQHIKNLKNLVKKYDRDVFIKVSLHKECFGYKWLNESNRNRNYASSTIKCDKDLSGWYRLGGGAGIKIPTSCVPPNTCGTVAPGWINGTHPTFFDGKVIRKVCYNLFGSCCRRSSNIEVVNCGRYYVYKLSNPPFCYLRYCGSDN